MASIGFSGNMEILCGVLGELLEEKSEQGIDVLARGSRA